MIIYRADHRVESEHPESSLALPLMNHMIVTRSFHTLGLSFLIYKMEIKKYFPTSESYCEAPNARRHIVTLQMASLEMHNKE